MPRLTARCARGFTRLEWWRTHGSCQIWVMCSFAMARLDWLYSTKEVYITIPPREKRWTREDKDPVALQAIPMQRH